MPKHCNLQRKVSLIITCGSWARRNTSINAPLKLEFYNSLKKIQFYNGVSHETSNTIKYIKYHEKTKISKKDAKKSIPNEFIPFCGWSSFFYLFLTHNLLSIFFEASTALCKKWNILLSCMWIICNTCTNQSIIIKQKLTLEN